MTTRFCQDIKKFVTSPRRLPSKRIYTFTRWVQAFKVGVWDGPFCKCAQEKCTCVLYICEYERHICHICINLWMYMNIMCIYIYTVCLFVYIYIYIHVWAHNQKQWCSILYLHMQEEVAAWSIKKSNDLASSSDESFTNFCWGLPRTWVRIAFLAQEEEKAEDVAKVSKDLRQEEWLHSMYISDLARLDPGGLAVADVIKLLKEILHPDISS